MSYVPTIFVSSTCYDLSQIRCDIKNCIEQDLGYTAMLSEFNSFPLDPDKTAVENCLRAVQQHADILLLIIGGRYGSVTDSEKSITNLEYLTAKSKGIPIYVFIKKSIIAALPLWRDNPSMNFTSTVDSVRLFEFVDELYKKENIWTNEFETAKEIIEVTKLQLGSLFSDCLELRQKFKSTPEVNGAKDISGMALKIVLEKPFAWEHRLFAQILIDEMSKIENKKKDLKYNISFGKITHFLDLIEVVDWLISKTNDLFRVSETLSILINDALKAALGEPGQAGDPQHIIYVGQKLISVYEYIVDWSLEFKCIEVPEKCQALLAATKNISPALLLDIERFCDLCCREVLSLPTTEPKDGGEIKISLVLTLSELDIVAYTKEVENLKILCRLN